MLKRLRFMLTKATTRDGQRRSFWTWHWPGDLVLLVFLAAGFLIPDFFGKSQVTLASFTALTICFCLAWQAFRGDYLDKWTPSMAWRIRIGATVSGCWLFLATPTLAGRFTAVAIYAVLYVLCERTVWHRARASHSPAT